MPKHLFIFLLCILLFSASLSERILPKLRVPEGLKVAVLSDDVAGARQIAYDANHNRLFISSKADVSTITILDLDENFKAVKKNHFTIEGGQELTGVAYRDNTLFIAALSTLWRIDNIDALVDQDAASILAARKILISDLPSETHHGRRYLRLDEKTNAIYFGVGVPCNICASPGPNYGTLIKADTETGKYQVVATGIRNTVGIDINPADSSVWFSENGRDGLGDDTPPDELNLLEEGADYGFPFIHGNDIRDPFYKKPPPNFVYKKPLYNFQAHVATLGIHFYRSQSLGKAYKNALFVAKHGSWNRSKRIGYEVSVLFLNGRKVVREAKFLSGFLTRGQDVLGRPADVSELKDGSLVVSDDMNGAIYRVFVNPLRERVNQPKAKGKHAPTRHKVYTR